MLAVSPAELILAAIATLIRFAAANFRRIAHDLRARRALLHVPQPTIARSVATTAAVVLASGAIVAAFAAATCAILA